VLVVVINPFLLRIDYDDEDDEENEDSSPWVT